MTTRQFVSTKGDTWEWEETPEVVAALSQLHKTTKETERKIANLSLKRPHERQVNAGGGLRKVERRVLRHILLRCETTG